MVNTSARSREASSREPGALPPQRIQDGGHDRRRPSDQFHYQTWSGRLSRSADHFIGMVEFEAAFLEVCGQLTSRADHQLFLIPGRQIPGS
jgi:hypothetical protein